MNPEPISITSLLAASSPSGIHPSLLATFNPNPQPPYTEYLPYPQPTHEHAIPYPLHNTHDTHNPPQPIPTFVEEVHTSSSVGPHILRHHNTPFPPPQMVSQTEIIQFQQTSERQEHTQLQQHSPTEYPERILQQRFPVPIHSQLVSAPRMAPPTPSSHKHSVASHLSPTPISPTPISQQNMELASRVPRTTPAQLIEVEDDKLLAKVNEMQSQIDRLSRAIIKKDNEELSTEINLNQVIAEKDRVLEVRNKELESSTRRIKQLIQETERKDLEIERLKLEIDKTNRLNNLSASISNLEDVEINHGPIDNAMSSTYLKNLVGDESCYFSRNNSHENFFKSDLKNKGKETSAGSTAKKSQLVPNFQNGLVSPASIDLQRAQPAESTIYRQSSERPTYY